MAPSALPLWQMFAESCANTLISLSLPNGKRNRFLNGENKSQKLLLTFVLERWVCIECNCALPMTTTTTTTRKNELTSELRQREEKMNKQIGFDECKQHMDGSTLIRSTLTDVSPILFNDLCNTINCDLTVLSSRYFFPPYTHTHTRWNCEKRAYERNEIYYIGYY